jgi:predicted aconitase with swiveling domain
MAQLIKLKRTSVEGRKPTTSNLELGELAINTYDGKIYFEKDNGTPSIKEIATEDTYHFYTTSLDSRYVNLTGDETIGGNKTFSNNITISGNLSVEGTTTTIDSTTVNIGDNTLELNYGGSQTTGGILIKDATGGSTTSGSLLWDSTNDYWKAGKLGSESEVITTSNIVTNLPSGTVSGSSQISLSGFNTSQLSENTNLYYTDTRVKTKLDAELVLSGSNLDGMTVSGSFSGSFQGDGSDLTGLSVDQVATITDTFTNTSSKVVTHNFGTKNVLVTVYDENDGYFIPNSIVTTNDNQVTVTFASTESGRVVVAKGGHVVQGVASDANLLDGQDGTYYLDYDNFTSVPSGIVSGSSQITDLTTHKETVSGASSYAVDHNLNEQYPIVQCWNTSTSQQEQAESVTTNSVNRVTVTFAGTFAGLIIVKK